MAKKLSPGEFQVMLQDMPADTADMIRGWLQRGDGVAVYINQELAHASMGHCTFVSYGSPNCQIEDKEPPVQLPDMEGMPPNWRYRLHGVYRGRT